MNEELSSLTLYLQDIKKFALLSHEQEVELAKAMEKGGEDGEAARDKMIQCNQRLIVSIAKRFQGCGVPLEDLIGEGQIGLLTAIEKFNHQRGNRFSTLAHWWISQAISRAVSNQGRIIRLPVHVSERLADLRRVSQQLEQEHDGRKPTNKEIAKGMGVPVNKVEWLLLHSQEPLNLERPVGDDDSVLGDFVEDEQAIDPGDAASQELLKEQMQDILHSLSERERKVLELRFGLVDGQSRTLEEVGDFFGVTRERIRQISLKALRKLRHPIRSRKLREWMEGQVVPPSPPEVILDVPEKTSKVMDKPYQSEKWLRTKYLDEQLGGAEIAYLGGCSKHTIYYYMDKFNIERRDGSASKLLHYGMSGKGLNYRDRAWLVENYCDRGMTLKEVGRLAGCDGSTILLWLKYFGIPVRTSWESRKLVQEMREELGMVI